VKNWVVRFRIIGIEATWPVKAETKEQAIAKWRNSHRNCFFVSIKERKVNHAHVQEG
jgi:hypothetical protein